jgi:uncharacterized cupin superfamily protein
MSRRKIEDRAADVKEVRMRFNLYGDDWDRDEAGFRTAAVGERLGAAELGASLYEVAAGETTWPYHFYHAAEELLIVLSGRVMLRAPAGERELGAGDVVVFGAGPGGAHEERNAGSEPARFLLVSTRPPVEVTEEPESGRVNVYSRRGTLRLRRPE